MAKLNLDILRAGILSDQSGQDTVEYLILATITVILCGIVLVAVFDKARAKSGQIQTVWPARSP